MSEANRQRPLLLVVLPILIGIVAFSFAYFFAQNYAMGALVKWHPLGLLPEETSVIEAVGFTEGDQEASLFIASVDGTVYRGSKSLCLMHEYCWREVDTIAVNKIEGEFYISDECSGRYKRISAPPGNIVTCAHYSDSSAGSQLIRDAYFVLLDDGSYWVWQFVPGSGALLIMLTGLCFSILLVILSRLWIRHYTSKPST